MQENEVRKDLEISPQSLVTIQVMAARIHQDGGRFFLLLSQSLKTKNFHNRCWIGDRLWTRG